MRFAHGEFRAHTKKYIYRKRQTPVFYTLPGVKFNKSVRRSIFQTHTLTYRSQSRFGALLLTFARYDTGKPERNEGADAAPAFFSSY